MQSCVFGNRSFRHQQRAIVEHSIGGCEGTETGNDCFVLMPRVGVSLCATGSLLLLWAGSRSCVHRS